MYASFTVDTLLSIVIDGCRGIGGFTIMSPLGLRGLRGDMVPSSSVSLSLQHEVNHVKNYPTMHHFEIHTQSIGAFIRF